MATLPRPWVVTPHGAYGYERRSAAEGSCGVTGYPCKHPGVDLVGEPGDPVYYPEDGEVVAVWAREPGTELPQPWRGYGPGVLVMRGASGRYHLLGHLEDDDLRRRWPRVTGDAAGSTQAQQDSLMSLVRKVDRNAFTVRGGDVAGLVSGARHVHWEVRKQTRTGGRYNPAIWARSWVFHNEAPANVEAAASADTMFTPESGLVILAMALLAAMAIPERKR